MDYHMYTYYIIIAFTRTNAFTTLVATIVVTSPLIVAKPTGLAATLLGSIITDGVSKVVTLSSSAYLLILTRGQACWRFMFLCKLLSGLATMLRSHR